MGSMANIHGAKEFWDQASEEENIALLSRMARLKSQGIDVEGIINLTDSQIPSAADDKDFTG